MKMVTLQVALIGVLGMAFQANATQTGLADWCVNLNGNVSAACNGAGSGNGNIALGSFDKTLEPASNNLGSITVTLGEGSNQFVSFYGDYDVDYSTFGSFQDSGSLHGALPSGLTYELDDPNASNLFSHFAANALTSTNSVGTASGPPNICCDVATALSFSGINVGTGQTGKVTFTVSTTAPLTGFYLQQTNFDTKDSIYMQETVVISGGGTGNAPEPASIALALLGTAALVAWKRRRAAHD